MRDVIDALRSARDDERIKAVVLDLDGLTGAGLSKLQEIAAELERFKQSGKPVIAVGDGYTRDQYYLAAQADDVFMHPMGLVLVDGYSRFLPYYKSLLDKIYVDYNVWTVGEYKSFVEPITRDDMSPQDEEAVKGLPRRALERLPSGRDGGARIGGAGTTAIRRRHRDAARGDSRGYRAPRRGLWARRRAIDARRDAGAHPRSDGRREARQGSGRHVPRGLAR